MAGKGDSVRAIFFALGANFAIFVAKAVAAALTGSGAMLAEAVHSLADCANQGLLLLGLRRARRAPTDDFPLGFGKAIYFWSFLVALLLFSGGGAFSLYEGFHKLAHPEPLRWPWIAVGVLGFAIAAELVSMAACMREVNKARGTQGVWRWFRESRQSELIVIFGEDLAALLGLVFALVAVLVTMITGNPLWDALGTLAIGVLLVVVAIGIANEVSQLLVGQSADLRTRDAIKAYVESQPEVHRLLNLITLQLGAEIMVAIKAEMSRDLATRGVADAINRVEVGLKQRFGDVRWCFFEPDVAD